MLGHRILWACVFAGTAKKVGIERHDHWSLVESIRTAKGPCQSIVATIGKFRGLNKKEHIGWEELRRILNAKPIPQPDLFEENEEPPYRATVNINPKTAFTFN